CPLEPHQPRGRRKRLRRRVGGDGSVDAGATESKREEIKDSRGESPGFDHGDLPPLDEQRRVIAETRRKFNEWLSGELGKARGNGS
ncbi:MAG: hypothetical protein M3254_08540, partial [Actinomycetota bacterium]|nr:hypothetical protein [Actinomycetota bacterium]